MSTETITFDRTTPLVPPVHDEVPAKLDPFSRDEVALLIDGYLRRLVALKNRLDPAIATGLARLREGERHLLLGFVTLKDYVAEALDFDWRKARYLLSIHDAFQGLPLLAEAFESGRLSWTKAREIARVADDETEEAWLDFALGVTVRRLADAVRQVASGGPPPWEGGAPAEEGYDRSEGGDRSGEAADAGTPPGSSCTKDIELCGEACAAGAGRSPQCGSTGVQGVAAALPCPGSSAAGEPTGLSCGAAGGAGGGSGAPGVNRELPAGEAGVAGAPPGLSCGELCAPGGGPDSAACGAAGVDDDPRGGWAAVSIPVPLALRLRWEEAIEACRRHAGADAPLWECAEYMAAETLDTLAPLTVEAERNVEEVGDGAAPGEAGSSSPGGEDAGPVSAGRGRHTCLGGGPGEGPGSSGGTAGDDRDRLIEDIESTTGNWSYLDWAPVAVALVGRLEADLRTVRGEAAGATNRDGVRRLHRALLRLAGDHERIERYLGRLLRFFGDHRLPRLCGFLGLRHYARERLGISDRQVGYLTGRERVLRHVPELEQAFLDGRLGSAKVRLLEPFLRRLWPCDWQAWVGRAEGVTVRRLADETRWALDYADRDQASWRARGGAPPAPGEGPYAIIDGVRHTCSDSTPGERSCPLADEVRHTCSGPGEGGPSPADAGGEEWHTRSATAHGALPGEGSPSAPGAGYAGAPPTGNRWHACSDPGEGISSSDDAGGEEWHTCSGPGGQPLASRVCFTAPPEVAAVWSRAMGACRRLLARSPHGPTAAEPGENSMREADPPAWRCLELIVDHFLLIWAPERDPEHRTDAYPRAIFERDGWRCTVPGCRARSNLTPHHIVRRSRGGGDEPANLTTVCWKHHLEGIHRGRLSVSGRAPDRLYWELGCRPGDAPVMAASGDRVAKAFDRSPQAPSTKAPSTTSLRSPAPSMPASSASDSQESASRVPSHRVPAPCRPGPLTPSVSRFGIGLNPQFSRGVVARRPRCP